MTSPTEGDDDISALALVCATCGLQLCFQDDHDVTEAMVAHVKRHHPTEVET